jgi:P-type Ca2+ transporter type 2C
MTLDNAYALSTQEVFTKLQSAESGLTSHKVKEHQTKFGLNVLAKTKQKGALRILLSQFSSFVVWVLLFAAAITFFIDHLLEFYVILVIVGFIILLNFFMEFGASQSMKALLAMAPKTALVVRDGQKVQIPVDEVTIGDIVVLQTGAYVPADARLFIGNDLRLDESALTGESEPVAKIIDAVAQKSVISQQKNMVFGGTFVTNGNGLAIVTAIGVHTEFGKISALLAQVEQPQTLLQKRLDKLTKQLSVIALVVAFFIFTIGTIKGSSVSSMLIFSLAVLVAGIPESLPTVVGITLANGVHKMAKNNAIVKKLPAVETLGTCTVICSDKTGTITQNKMVVQHVCLSTHELTVGGEGYIPEGGFFKDGKEHIVKSDKSLQRLLEIGVVCNNAELRFDDGNWHVAGAATESALLVLARKAGVGHENFAGDRIKEYPFNSTRKCMSVIFKRKNETFSFVKGAPEIVLHHCSSVFVNGEQKPLSEAQRQKFKDRSDEYARKGLRVLALAYKKISETSVTSKGGLKLTESQAESTLVFCGLVAIRDPPEPSARESVLTCKAAGIRVVMITGDNEVTARAIAEEVGIYEQGDTIVTGKQLDEYDEASLIAILDKVTVFARVTPEHKLKIVQMLQAKGHVVAMTGDGVNDAPALKRADIGIAMGRSGTDVAKESAELVLKDDNFKTIVVAVEHGRTIYENIRKFIYYLLVGNFSLLMVLLIAGIVAGSAVLPLTALMVLFMNIITNDFPAIGLSFESPTKQIMKQRPRNPKEGILSTYLLLNIISLVPLVVLSSILLFTWALQTSLLAKAQTLLFVTLIMFMTFHAINSRNWNESSFDSGLFSNWVLIVGIFLSSAVTVAVVQLSFLQSIFGTVTLSGSEWGLCLLVAVSILLFVEIKKLVLKVEVEEMEKQLVKLH